MSTIAGDVLLETFDGNVILKVPPVLKGHQEGTLYKGETPPPTVNSDVLYDSFPELSVECFSSSKYH
ncbi:hypothetical protein [Paenimyroides ceti]